MAAVNLPNFSIFSESLVGINAPEFPSEVRWLNSQPLKIENLIKDRKTILLDFWTYTCVNCLRTLPYLIDWHEKYKDLGLTIIGVHTPEFEFEKTGVNVRRFLQEQKIKYPVVLDNEKRMWDSYANNFWPRKLLIDTHGRIRYDHAGEGAYTDTESQIQNLLLEGNLALKFDRVIPEIEHSGAGAVCYPTTPEVYAGYKKGVWGNREGYLPNRKFEYHYQGGYEDGKIYLEGVWVVQPEYLAHGRAGRGYEDFLILKFHGLELNVVMRTKSERIEEVKVTLNDKAVPLGFRGRDLKEKGEETVVRVKEPRMYNLIRTGTYGSYVLKLAVKPTDFEIYAFTFGGCFH